MAHHTLFNEVTQHAKLLVERHRPVNAVQLPQIDALDAQAPALLRGALLREKAHGGQSFVVVPRISDMDPLAAELAKLVPELSVIQAHGKMAAADLDEAMIRFAGGGADVLLATNIIEAGLDVPRANTMIVCHAELLSFLGDSDASVGGEIRTPDIDEDPREATEGLVVAADESGVVDDKSTEFVDGERVDGIPKGRDEVCIDDARAD